ncbi:TetR family transcriptional regulator [Nocardia tenerifensis]|uniref:TetR family transcriptional regulator n=1 Tax=Nocardia tenerifensis TaxID=228006 RepID=A0A318JTW7_9NOCA|nr:TetR/AcrR family transcriptional regulator [Nocardia tenerifensis]PXX60231.1 TetR family transcriptional regulator [Nocardia tenerifensis]
MSTKRELVLDTAIELLGSRGLRALTHRAIDEEAAIPAGSTSNYFRTREALLTGITKRLEERDHEDWTAPSRLPAPGTLEELIRALAAFIQHATTTDRVRTLARYALFAEAQTVAPLQKSVQRGHRRLTEWAETMLAPFSADPTLAKMLVDYADGAILHQLVSPAPDFDPFSSVDRLTRALLDAR